MIISRSISDTITQSWHQQFRGCGGVTVTLGTNPDFLVFVLHLNGKAFGLLGKTTCQIHFESLKCCAEEIGPCFGVVRAKASAELPLSLLTLQLWEGSPADSLAPGEGACLGLFHVAIADKQFAQS